MFEKRLHESSKKADLFEQFVELIEARFGTSSEREFGHTFIAPEGATDEDIERAIQEYIDGGGNPDGLFITIRLVSAKGSPPEDSGEDEDRPLSPGFTRVRTKK